MCLIAWLYIYIYTISHLIMSTPQLGHYLSPLNWNGSMAKFSGLCHLVNTCSPFKVYKHALASDINTQYILSSTQELGSLVVGFSCL